MLELKRSEVLLPFSGGQLRASYCDPAPGTALVVFAHGSGSSRLSPRNIFVADCLNVEGFGTLLVDLLTEEEDQVFENRFDIPLLSSRLCAAVHWARAAQLVQNAAVGLFGASTGAAAALTAAAELGGDVSAVVSRGGRPDLAVESLSKVGCPTLLIVGGLDGQVISLNEAALAQLPAGTVKQLVIVPGATHLFEEPGTLQQVATLARDWFVEHTRL